MPEDREADDLEKLLNKKVESKGKVMKPDDYLPQDILFTKGAYQKADMIGPIIKELTGRDLEWSGFMLAAKDDKEYVVRDILLEKGQDITQGNVVIDGEVVAKVGYTLKERNKEKGENLYVIGWIHGHGIGYLKPSITDEENFGRVLNSVSLNTERKVDVPFNLIETDLIKKMGEGKIILRGSALEDASVVYDLTNDPLVKKILEENGINVNDENVREKALKLLSSLLDASNPSFQEPNIFGFSYFVIVNNKHEKPYAALAVNSHKVITEKKDSKLITGYNIKEVEVEKDINVEKDELVKEIKENIDLPSKPKPFKPWPRRRKRPREVIVIPSDDEKRSENEKPPVYQEVPSSSPGTYYQDSSRVNQFGYWVSDQLIALIEKRIKECQQKGVNVSKTYFSAPFFEMLKKVASKYNDRMAQHEVIDDFFYEGDPTTSRPRPRPEPEPREESKGRLEDRVAQSEEFRIETEEDVGELLGQAAPELEKAKEEWLDESKIEEKKTDEKKEPEKEEVNVGEVKKEPEKEVDGKEKARSLIDELDEEEGKKVVVKKEIMVYTPERPDNDLSKYLFLPGRTIGNYDRPDLLVGFKRLSAVYGWEDTKKLANQENFIIYTLTDFVDLLKLLVNGEAFDGNGQEIAKSMLNKILDDIIGQRDPWRAEWIDAYFEVERGEIFITYHRIKEGKLVEIKEPVKGCLMHNGTIKLDDWLSNTNDHGLPSYNVKLGDGNITYIRPYHNRVVKFSAYSGCVTLRCAEINELASVRPVKVLGTKEEKKETKADKEEGRIVIGSKNDIFICVCGANYIRNAIPQVCMVCNTKIDLGE